MTHLKIWNISLLLLHHLQMGALQQQIDKDTNIQTESISRADSSTPASNNDRRNNRNRNMHQWSILILGSLLLQLLQLLPVTVASPVFVDNPSLAQCKYSRLWNQSKWTLDSFTTHFNGMKRRTERHTKRQSDSHLHVHRDIIQLHLFLADDGFSSELQHFLSRRLLKKRSDLSRVFLGRVQWR